MRWRFRLFTLSAISFACSTLGAAPPGPGDPQICVDHFGYEPFAPKIAVLRGAVSGFDAPDSYAPGPVIQLRRCADDAVVFSAAPAAWNSGAVHSQSGDRAWWFDFSAWRGAGVFYIYDPTNERASEPFEIAPDVQRRLLRPAIRMYYYQRCGTPKSAIPAGEAWADDACHVGPLQDSACRSILNPTAATARDLSGGWHDAGDFNKYVNYADDALHMLLDAVDLAPHGAGDYLNIPESGNGVSDLLDEIRWELLWMLKMQNADGSVLHKISVSQFQSASPASADGAQRYYAPPTASATISACGAFAHGADVFLRFGGPSMQPFAGQLESAAISAWNWLEANPAAIPSSYNNQGFLNAAAEDDAYDQEMNRLRGAAYLFRITGDATYRGWFDARYASAHLFQWGYAMSWEETAQNGLLAYAQTAGATASVVTAIRTAYSQELASPSLLGEFVQRTDAYRAHLYDGDYAWGTNRTKSIKGHMFAAMTRLGWNPESADIFRAAGAGFVHNLHGVNPLGICYLTNMQDAGSERSLNEMYHAWFGDGTAWDNAQTSLFGPPPGFVTGGANPHYEPDAAYSGPPISPPMLQPIQKSYRDWNTGWPENSWSISECHIPYQAAYVRLLAEFSACNGGDCAGDMNEDGAVSFSDAAGALGCAAGPDNPGCAPGQLMRIDFEADGDLDLRDMAYMQAAVGDD